jgi:hypothetical protein
MDFDDVMPGLPYPAVDLEDLGLQAERLTGDAFACQRRLRAAAVV